MKSRADVAAKDSPATATSDSATPVPSGHYDWRARLVVLGIAVLIPPALIVVFTFNPTEHGFYPGCLWYQSTGTHCPGCGSTRALHALLRGQFLQAVAYNIPIFFVLPFLAYYFGGLAIGMVRNRPVQFYCVPKWLPPILFTVLVLYWVLRNIPVYPLNLLAPHSLSCLFLG